MRNNATHERESLDEYEEHSHPENQSEHQNQNRSQPSLLQRLVH